MLSGILLKTININCHISKKPASKKLALFNYLIMVWVTFLFEITQALLQLFVLETVT